MPDIHIEIAHDTQLSNLLLMEKFDLHQSLQKLYRNGDEKAIPLDL